MRILMISPGYPGQMPSFANALTSVGAGVFGLGDQHRSSLPDSVRDSVVAHLQVPNLWDENAVIHRVLEEVAKVRMDRVECLWEPAMMLAAKLRQTLDLPGLTVDQTLAFRDKEVMKQRLDAAGIRTPSHARALTKDQVRAAAGSIGFPLIVKPIDGAGSTDTYRIDNVEELENVLPMLTHIRQVSVEEYISGDEFTYDTVCAGGRILYENIAWYQTKPIEEKKHQWVSPACLCLRNLDMDDIQDGRRMGRRVIEAMGFRTGFTHMEWFRKSDGEVVFGEIAARPAGAQLVDAMNYASDIDLFRGWANAVCHGGLGQHVERKYNSAVIGKRAQGRGRIREIVGLDQVRHEFGPAIAGFKMPSIGSPSGDWRAGSPSDGYVFVRHPDLEACREIADRVSRDVQIYAG